ncbi:MAG: hypothetical protein D6726_12105 [Nitrospirae bacterium]|nr:MAG: hypothetical protein D6726_12105 [Nitrospirota bacterium]
MSGKGHDDVVDECGTVENPGRREIIKKAAYTAPALICIGLMFPASEGYAQSCESSPLGCPPPPPGQSPLGMPNDTFPFDYKENK